MEDTLRVLWKRLSVKNLHVLILVLMEDTLRDERESVQDAREVVLILVLMEDTLRDYHLLAIVAIGLGS